MLRIGTAGEHRAFTVPKLVSQDAALRLRVEANALILLARAWWQSGDAADCKSANAGSIPAQASSATPARDRSSQALRGQVGSVKTPRLRIRSAAPARGS